MLELENADKKSRIKYIPIYGSQWPMPFFLIIMVSVLFPVWWAIAHRTWEDFLRYSLFLGLAASITSSKTYFELVKLFWMHKKRGAALYLIAEFPFGVLAIGALIYCYFATFGDMLLLLYSFAGTSYSAAFGVMLLTLVVGLLLFLFRLRYRATYGVTEVFAGICIAGYKFVAEGANAALSSPNFYLALLTAGIYLVVRGLDNIHQGLYKEPLDPIPKLLKKHFEVKFSRVQLEKPNQ